MYGICVCEHPDMSQGFMRCARCRGALASSDPPRIYAEIIGEEVHQDGDDDRGEDVR